MEVHFRDITQLEYRKISSLKRISESSGSFTVTNACDQGIEYNQAVASSGFASVISSLGVKSNG